MPAKIEDWKIERILELYEEGYSSREIGRRLDIGNRTVMRYVNINGIKPMTLKERTREIKRNIIEKHKIGVYEPREVTTTTKNNNRRKHHFDESVFDHINTEEKAYWLGFLYADGCVTSDHRRVDLTIKDREHVEKYCDFMGVGRNAMRTITCNNLEYYEVRLNSSRLASSMIRNGVVPRKSLILEFPSDNIVPKYLVRHFIRGYFDGDGCVKTRFRQYHESSNLNIVCEMSLVGTSDFLSGVQTFFEKELDIQKNNPYQHGENTYEYSKTGKEAYILLDYLYNDSSIFLERKYDKFIAALYSDM